MCIYLGLVVISNTYMVNKVVWIGNDNQFENFVAIKVIHSNFVFYFQTSVPCDILQQLIAKELRVLIEKPQHLPSYRVQTKRNSRKVLYPLIPLADLVATRLPLIQDKLIYAQGNLIIYIIGNELKFYCINSYNQY